MDVNLIAASVIHVGKNESVYDYSEYMNKVRGGVS